MENETFIAQQAKLVGEQAALITKLRGALEFYAGAPWVGRSGNWANSNLAEVATIALEATGEAAGAELETLRMQLAACMTATVQNTEATIKDRIGRDNPYWCQAYADVCTAVDREMRERKRAEEAEALNANLRAALDASLNGLRWYRSEYPERSSQADDEHDALVTKLLEATPASAVQEIAKLTAQLTTMRKAFQEYVKWHGPCLNCHPDDAGPDDAEAALVDDMVNAALADEGPIALPEARA